MNYELGQDNTTYVNDSILRPCILEGLTLSLQEAHSKPFHAQKCVFEVHSSILSQLCKKIILSKLSQFFNDLLVTEHNIAEELHDLFPK